MYQGDVHCNRKVHGRDIHSQLHGSGKGSWRPKECVGVVKEVEKDCSWEEN